MNTINIGIAGGRGYVAGELLRLLVHHPNARIAWVQSSSAPGQAVGKTHLDLAHLDLTFTDQPDPAVDLIFLCQGHGRSRQWITDFLNRWREQAKTAPKIIDLGNDFRLNADAHFAGREFVYGLVEANRDRIRTADAVANPGCFATAIQLALLPLARGKLLRSDVHIHAVTGATGAGATLRETSHFAYRQNNLSIYKPFAHQHLGEIGETLTKLAEGAVPELHFLPLRGDFTRGIFASLYTETDLDAEDLLNLYRAYYADHVFVHVTDQTVHLKQVVNTNFCYLQVQKINGKALITSVIDNLLIGAAGRAVQNMNLLFDLPETTGLQLKSSAF